MEWIAYRQNVVALPQLLSVIPFWKTFRHGESSQRSRIRLLDAVEQYNN
jgi:hypothetical protein